MFKHIFSIMLIGLALSVPVHAKSSYGPVRGQDTLWSIASKLKPKGNVTVQQTMLALYHKNPHAFDGNINKLFKGAHLKAPTYAEVRRYNPKSAVRESGRHNKHWKRGTKLPKATPPKVPDIKDPAKAQASRKAAGEKPVAKPVDKKTAPAIAKANAEPKATAKPVQEVVTVPQVSAPTAAVVASVAAIQSGSALEKEIVTLREQLKAEQEKNQHLTNELKTLQAKQAKSGSTPSIEEQVRQLKADLKELETVLDQKDNHIKTLQASLKSASEAIKSQHEDNMRLANKLREVSPASLPPEAAASGKPGLTLAGVQEQNEAVAAEAVSAMGTQETPADSGAATPESVELAQVWADGGKQEAATVGNPVLNSSAGQSANDVRSGSVRLTEMLGFKSSQSAAPATGEGGESRRSISPLALAIALISLLFIVALLWRALVQQRELRRIEAEEERMAERMRKRLEENSAGATLSKREPLANLSAPAEVNF